MTELTIVEQQQQWCLARRYVQGDEFVWCVASGRAGELFFDNAFRAIEVYNSIVPAIGVATLVTLDVGRPSAPKPLLHKWVTL